VTDNRIDAQRIPIKWNADMPVFAKEPFLKAVGDEYGWLGGIDAAGSLRCILPYTVVRKAGVRMVRFRMETLPCSAKFGIAEERSFLDSVVEHFRRDRADVIIPSSTNTIFRTYPSEALAAPYASHVADLSVADEALWSAVSTSHRRHIRAAAKSGVVVRSDPGQLQTCHAIIRDTFRKSSMPFMSSEALSRMVDGLGDDVKVIVAEKGGAVQSCAVMPFSRHTAYYVYGGSVPNAAPGSMHLLHWEAMRQFKDMGVRRYDFCGARVNPEPGSKAAGLAAFKERFGTALVSGYMWKCPLRPLRAAIYSLAVRWFRGGDIVDAERHKVGSPLGRSRDLTGVNAERKQGLGASDE
jgi:hypothetical protein